MAFKIIHNQTQIVRLGGKKQKKCAQRNLWNTPAIMCTIPTSMPEFSQTCNKCNVFVPLIFVSPPPSLVCVTVCVCVRGGVPPKRVKSSYIGFGEGNDKITRTCYDAFLERVWSFQLKRTRRIFTETLSVWLLEGQSD